MCSRYLPEFIARHCFRIPCPPRIALSRNKTLRMLEDGSATTPPLKRVESGALEDTPTEASSPVGHVEKDTVASPPAKALSPGVCSLSGTEEADNERDEKDKAEEKEKDSRSEETESQGNQSDKMDKGKVDFDDSSQVPPSPVLNS